MICIQNLAMDLKVTKVLHKNEALEMAMKDMVAKTQKVGVIVFNLSFFLNV